MIRYVACVLGGMLFAHGHAQAHEPLVTGANLICIGFHACEMATYESCTVALGDNVEIPKGANHVLVTPTGTRPLYVIDKSVKALIDREVARVAATLGVNPVALDFIDRWNKECGRDKLVPIS